jgi:ubiquinol-cytochrome c reductase cytochrome c subunit
VGIVVAGLAAIVVALAVLPASFGHESATPSPLASVSTPSPDPSSAGASPTQSPSGPATPSPSVSGAAADSGAALYKNYCSSCHGPSGQGIAGDGPTFAGAAFPGIVAEKVRVGGGGMPALGSVLSASQIQAVSTYVAQQLADSTAAQAKLGEGGEWYRLYCAGCHGATGRGGALSKRPNAVSFANMPAANALAAMEIGPSAMPVFASTLDPVQKAAITLYVQQLVTPDSPGGNGLGFIGPVVEGAVGWFFLVVLILIAVWLAWGKGRERA